MKKKQQTRKSVTHKTKTDLGGSGPLFPLADRVVLQIPDREERTASGIYIPDSAKDEKPEQGVVIAVGPGRMLEDGSVAPVSVSIGDTVVFSKYGPDEIVVHGKKYLVVREESILAIIK